MFCGALEGVWLKNNERISGKWNDLKGQVAGWSEGETYCPAPPVLDERTKFKSRRSCYCSCLYRRDDGGAYAIRYKLEPDSEEMLTILYWYYPAGWAHFYRPEVWLAIVFGSLWIWHVIAWCRKRRREAATQMRTKSRLEAEPLGGNKDGMRADGEQKKGRD